MWENPGWYLHVGEKCVSYYRLFNRSVLIDGCVYPKIDFPWEAGVNRSNPWKSANNQVSAFWKSIPKTDFADDLDKQVLAFQKSWRSFSPIIVCILAHCMLPFWTSRACTCRFILSSDCLHLNCDLSPFNTCFQRGCCLIFWKHPSYSWYVMVMYLACETFIENHLTTLDSTFFLKLMPENQDRSGHLSVYVQIPLPQDVFTNQIWDS